MPIESACDLGEPVTIAGDGMKNLLIRWVILVLALVGSCYATSLFMPGFTIEPGVAGVVRLFIGAAILAIVNATLGKLLKLMAIPINCLTFGLFSLVINAALLYAVGTLGFGFSIKGFFPAFVGSIFMAAISAILNTFVSDDKDKD